MNKPTHLVIDVDHWTYGHLKIGDCYCALGQLCNQAGLPVSWESVYQVLGIPDPDDYDDDSEATPRVAPLWMANDPWPDDPLSPDHRAQIVKAFKAEGITVTFSDGVNP